MEGGKKTGRTFAVLDDGLQNTAMKEAGFVDIQEKWIKVHFLIQFQSLLFTSSSPISAYVGPKRRLAEGSKVERDRSIFADGAPIRR